MDLTQLIYTSKPFGFDDRILNGILADARRCNERDDITGALICRADVYLQLLEGPKAAIDAALSRITKDDRHLDLVSLSYTPATERLFPMWSMRDDPARTWFWTREEVAKGALTRATRSDLMAIFARMSDSSDEYGS